MACALALRGWFCTRGHPADRPGRDAKCAAASSHRAFARRPAIRVANAIEGSPDEYLAFGMTDALIGELSRIRALKVISQTSAMQYKGVRKTLPEIARELGVTTVVEGSVVNEGGQVRLTVQLIDARTDSHLWTQTYSRDPATALSTQRALAREVAGLIRSRLVPSDRSTTPIFQQTNPAAYESYVRGRYFLQQPGEASMAEARGFFEQSIAADPNFAPAHVELSNYFVLTDALHPADAMPRAMASARRALALDDSSARCARLAGVRALLWRMGLGGRRPRVRARARTGSERRANPALACALSELDGPPRHGDRGGAARHRSGSGLDRRLRYRGSSVVECSPFRQGAGAGRGGFATSVPTIRAASCTSAIGHLYQGRFADAVAWAQKGVEITGGDPSFLCVLAIAQHRAGQTQQAQQTLAELDRLATTAYVPDVFLAGTYLWLRGHDTAVKQLHRAFERRDSYLVVANVAPWFESAARPSAISGHPAQHEVPALNVIR